MLRRSFLTLPTLAMVPGQLLAAGLDAVRSIKPMVRSGQDREGKARAIGLSSTTYKVLTADSGGDLFVMEQSNNRRGGPSRHIHHHEDELFFCLEGQYVVEVNDTRYVLDPGDCILGPRGLPHAWAFSGHTVGRMLISFAPAGKMEAFFAQRQASGIKPGEYARTKSDAAFMAAFGLEYVGPPIALSSL